ncbi:MAG: hypothetical protein KGV50_00240 [Gammaproteobacteria bacterium]|nr:hypothetical protein [Gammaproteobacteria bacterium]
MTEEIAMNLTEEEKAIIEKHRNNKLKQHQNELLFTTVIELLEQWRDFHLETGYFFSYSVFCGEFNAEERICDELKYPLNGVYRLLTEAHESVRDIIKELK